ncbi:MAG TPA: transporter [Vicinamibacterales bacterium]|nr:transporter [Vicinamibacterales bacterium]
MTRTLMATLVAAACSVAPAYAQLNGENLLGDMGVKSGTQPEPGVYVAHIYYRYYTDSIRGPAGDPIVLDPTGAGSQTIHAAVPLVIYVSRKTFLGANYSAMTVMPFANGSLEAPGLGLSEHASTGPSDLYVMPVQLGWHLKRADAVAGFAFFAPTGRHAAGASDNVGKGMWSYEVSAGTTVYLDKQRTWSLATAGFWETHSKKEGELRIQNLAISDVKVGQLFTLEGGVGKSFLHGAAGVGLAYYAQWKVTSDEMRFSAPVPSVPLPQDRHRVWGLGPDVTIPIATKKRLISLLNVRYLWERGARIKTQGGSLLVTSTFPIGGIPIRGRQE